MWKIKTAPASACARNPICGGFPDWAVFREYDFVSMVGQAEYGRVLAAVMLSIVVLARS